jgi:glycosyltransferase involved in cell wall biosynthesis
VKISYNTDPGNFNTSVGYGYAGYHVVTALQRLGHKVPFADATAPVELWFCQPEYWEFSNPDQYKIGYWPWESTKLHDSWYYHVDKADELWTTSEWCRQVYETELGRPVHVYEHGIEDLWTPHSRAGRDKLRFLHHGEPAVRKAGQMVVDVFIELFDGNPDVELTLKAHNSNLTRILNRRGENIGVPDSKSNITIITKEYTVEDLVKLYHEHDVLVYPSWGEGFGFIPLQALATGMPTICTGAWAPYKEFLGDFALDAKLVDSPWEPWHTGQMYLPDKDHLRQLMWKAYEDYQAIESKFYSQAQDVHARYNWDTLTENAFDHIVKKFS